MNKFFYCLLILGLLICSCSSEDHLEGIEISLDKNILNPVQDSCTMSTLKVYGVYNSGKKISLALDDVLISVKTKKASGNVDVVRIENSSLYPLAGGIAEVSAIYIKAGHTFVDKEKIVVTPYYRDYHQTLVMKLFMAYDGSPMEKNKSDACFQQTDPSKICTFEEALEVVKKVDKLTRGIPKIIYLVGWQRGGHDHLYPDWSIVNPNLKRFQDATALESLRWLIKEAKNYNTTISLHINMVDAFEESPLWDEYVKQGIISRDKQGNLSPVWEVVKGHKAYHISYTKEWECGLTKRRINRLIEMVPELVDGHTIHVDAFIAYWEPKNSELSPYLASKEGIDRYKEVETQRKIFNYWRKKGFDVTGEGLFWAHPEGEGFIGLQPMSWWYPNDIEFQMEIPECLSARGRVDRNGQGDFRFGSSMQGEDIFLKDKINLPGFLEQFCTMTLPWYYLSRLERLELIDGALYYSNGVVAKVENGKRIIRKDDFILRENDNLFVPALWHDKEIIAFSKDGYQTKCWKLPEDWRDVKSVDVYKIMLSEYKLLISDLPVYDGTITLTLNQCEGVSIIPAGSVLK